MITDFKPMNAHGKRMPKAPTRKLEQLFQVFVEDRETGEEIAIAPRMSRRALEPLVEKINRTAIANPQSWARNARLVPVQPF